MAARTTQSAASGPAERAEPVALGDIALRAYELFEERGREPGRDLDDWLRAERELKQPSQRRTSVGVVTT